ncbi:MAG: nucleotide sugar dehydrogenase [Limisphaerales bacterium]
MRISIFGLGYVGTVTAGCLSRQGHSIVGVDVQPQKVAAFNRAEALIREPGLDERLREARDRGLLRATSDCAEAIAATEISIVCVGTPSDNSGALDPSFVQGVTRQIGAALRAKAKPHVLVLRSTMLPGSTARLMNESLADLATDGSLRIYYYPEFLREGTAVNDFDNPALAVVGSRDGSRPPAELMAALFGDAAAVVDWPTAELVKYACNAFHATKVTFANEIGRLAKQLNIDSQAVMALLCRDTRLNLSPYYLRPGNPFGGSCLPKDVRALTQHARATGLTLPLLENLLPSNAQHSQSLLNRVQSSGHNEVVLLGLAFKSNTDDLRESPMVDLAQSLIGRGFALRIYDPQLNLANLIGSNKRAIDIKMPHLASLLQDDLAAALGRRGLVVVAQRCAPLTDLARLVTREHHLLDVNGWPELRGLPGTYEGFCW